jgi:hypothetical protein
MKNEEFVQNRIDLHRTQEVDDSRSSLTTASDIWDHGECLVMTDASPRSETEGELLSSSTTSSSSAATKPMTTCTALPVLEIVETARIVIPSSIEP